MSLPQGILVGLLQTSGDLWFFATACCAILCVILSFQDGRQDLTQVRMEARIWACELIKTSTAPHTPQPHGLRTPRDREPELPHFPCCTHLRSAAKQGPS